MFEYCDIFSMLGKKPALVAQLDARWTGDEEVADSTAARVATFFHGD